MPRIALPEPVPTHVALEEALRNRSSFNSAASERTFGTNELGSLLGHALRAREDSSHRAYPSGGALFPIETYLIGTSVEGQMPGVFHYHPTAHALEVLWELPDSFSMAKLIRSPITPLSNTLVVFTALWERSARKYGDFAYSHALLEAGHMAQNITLVATALGIQNRPVAGCDDAMIASLLDLNTDNEQFVYGVLISPPRMHAPEASSL